MDTRAYAEEDMLALLFNINRLCRDQSQFKELIGKAIKHMYGILQARRSAEAASALAKLRDEFAACDNFIKDFVKYISDPTSCDIDPNEVLKLLTKNEKEQVYAGTVKDSVLDLQKLNKLVAKKRLSLKIKIRSLERGAGKNVLKDWNKKYQRFLIQAYTLFIRKSLADNLKKIDSCDWTKIATEVGFAVKEEESKSTNWEDVLCFLMSDLGHQGLCFQVSADGNKSFSSIDAVEQGSTLALKDNDFDENSLKSNRGNFYFPVLPDSELLNVDMGGRSFPEYALQNTFMKFLEELIKWKSSLQKQKWCINLMHNLMELLASISKKLSELGAEWPQTTDETAPQKADSPSVKQLRDVGRSIVYIFKFLCVAPSVWNTNPKCLLFSLFNMQGTLKYKDIMKEPLQILWIEHIGNFMLRYAGLDNDVYQIFKASYDAYLASMIERVGCQDSGFFDAIIAFTKAQKTEGSGDHLAFIKEKLLPAYRAFYQALVKIFGNIEKKKAAEAVLKETSDDADREAAIRTISECNKSQLTDYELDELKTFSEIICNRKYNREEYVRSEYVKFLANLWKKALEKRIQGYGRILEHLLENEDQLVRMLKHIRAKYVMHYDLFLLKMFLKIAASTKDHSEKTQDCDQLLKDIEEYDTTAKELAGGNPIKESKLDFEAMKRLLSEIKADASFKLTKSNVTEIVGDVPHFQHECNRTMKKMSEFLKAWRNATPRKMPILQLEDAKEEALIFQTENGLVIPGSKRLQEMDCLDLISPLLLGSSDSRLEALDDRLVIPGKQAIKAIEVSQPDGLEFIAKVLIKKLGEDKISATHDFRAFVSEL